MAAVAVGVVFIVDLVFGVLDALDAVQFVVSEVGVLVVLAILPTDQAGIAFEAAVADLVVFVFGVAVVGGVGDAFDVAVAVVLVTEVLTGAAGLGFKPAGVGGSDPFCFESLGMLEC